MYGRCDTAVLQKGQAFANVIATCHASSQPSAPGIYTDEHNQADLEKFGVRLR